jgi:glycosyltransferase involved in cell wall biosynthesis
MPFLSPLWDPGPRVVVLHHAHTEMWPMVLDPKWARLGDLIERRLAPPIYRRSRIVTLSESSKRELVANLGLRAERITVVPPGIDERFTPGPAKAPDPLAVAVGRLMPVKRFDRLVRTAAAVRARVPGFRLVIVGEGQERPDLEQLVDDLGAGAAVALPGRVSDADLVALYQRAWVIASASAAEGWGMSLTEAAACGTPAVATAITGHADAVVDGHTGILVDPHDESVLTQALVRVLTDGPLRDRLGAQAARRASRFTWGTTAVDILRALADEAARHRRRGRR